MPTFLSDPSISLYIVLSIVVFVLFGIWINRRQRGDLIRLLAGVAVLVALFLVDRFVESPREESTRKMQEIVTATKAKSADGVGKHISESFEYNKWNKARLLEWVKSVYGNTQFEGIDTSGYGRSEFEKIDDNKVKIIFEVWPTSYGLPDYRHFCTATFVKDPDGQFRMQTFKLTKKHPSAGEEPVVPEQIR
jgi:hypothetical protein